MIFWTSEITFWTVFQKKWSKNDIKNEHFLKLIQCHETKNMFFVSQKWHFFGHFFGPLFGPPFWPPFWPHFQDRPIWPIPSSYHLLSTPNLRTMIQCMTNCSWPPKKWPQKWPKNGHFLTPKSALFAFKRTIGTNTFLVFLPTTHVDTVSKVGGPRNQKSKMVILDFLVFDLKVVKNATRAWLAKSRFPMVKKPPKYQKWHKSHFFTKKCKNGKNDLFDPILTCSPNPLILDSNQRRYSKSKNEPQKSLILSKNKNVKNDVFWGLKKTRFLAIFSSSRARPTSETLKLMGYFKDKTDPIFCSLLSYSKPLKH